MHHAALRSSVRHCNLRAWHASAAGSRERRRRPHSNTLSPNSSGGLRAEAGQRCAREPRASATARRGRTNRRTSPSPLASALALRLTRRVPRLPRSSSPTPRPRSATSRRRTPHAVHRLLSPRARPPPPPPPSLPPSRAASPRTSLAHERSLGLRAYLRAPTSTVEGARSAQRLSGPDQAYSASNPRMLLPPSVWARLCRLLGRSAGLTDPTPPPSAPPHADGAAQGSEHPGPAQHVGLPYRRL